MELFCLTICGKLWVIERIQMLFFLIFFCIQDAIRSLKPLNPVSLSVSSRTDTGVHALSNSAHFDLQRKNDKPPFTEDILVEALNYHLREEQIRWVRTPQMSVDWVKKFNRRDDLLTQRLNVTQGHANCTSGHISTFPYHSHLKIFSLVYLLLWFS